MPGIEVNAENLTNEFLPLSLTQPVILICWSARSPESLEVVATLGRLALADQGAWTLGRVDIDDQPQVAQALQTRAVPFAVAIIGEQLVQAKSRIAELTAEMKMKDAVMHEKERLIQSKDAVIVSKDAEICRLHADLARVIAQCAAGGAAHHPAPARAAAHWPAAARACATPPPPALMPHPACS